MSRIVKNTFLFSLLVVFLFTIFPLFVKEFFYQLGLLFEKNRIIFLFNYYQNMITLGFVLVSSSIIFFALFRKRKILKVLSILMFSFGFLVLSIFLFFKPVDDRIAFRKENGKYYMYTGFHVKDKVFFTKKVAIEKK